MKCGKEIGEKQVFCDSCLAEMKQYPVKQDAHVFLPNRTTTPVKKAAPRKKVLAAEERLSQMRKAIQWLSISLAVAVLSLVLSIALLADALTPEHPGGVIGQNYSTIDAADNTN